jgi:type VI secretion system protein ImpF
MTPRGTLLWDLLAHRGADLPAPPPTYPQALLRESVRHELGLLFNSTALAATESFEQLSHAGRSTLNYGLPDLAGRTASSIDHGWLAAQLTQAIRTFEPRLRADSVQVRVRPARPASHNVVSFEIDAVFHQHAAAEPVQFDSELDLESGVVSVVERARAPRALS